MLAGFCVPVFPVGTMTLFAPMWWMFWLSSVLGGFTFTDAEDFAPLLTLIVGGAAACVLICQPRRPASWPLTATMLVLSLWPILPNIGLLLLAREFQRVNGAWPQVMANDPKLLLGDVSPRYDNLFSVVNYLQAFAGAWMVNFWALMLLLRTRFSLFQWRLFWGVCLFAMAVFILDPGALHAWWLD